MTQESAHGCHLQQTLCNVQFTRQDRDVNYFLHRLAIAPVVAIYCNLSLADTAMTDAALPHVFDATAAR
ncbi:MAG: hypothetical protein ACK40R_06680, partial [Thermomonas sp.]